MATIFKSIYRDGGSCDFIIKDYDKEIGILAYGGRLIASVNRKGFDKPNWIAICFSSGECDLFKNA